MIIMTGDHGDVFEEYPRLPWSTAGSVARQIPGVKRLFWGDGHLGHLGRPLVEEIVHVPLFMKLPDSNLGGQIEPGQVELIDILPTIIDVVGGDIPPTVEGRSLLPLIRGEIEAKNTVRAEMEPSPISGLNRMIRGERYKYLTWQQPGLSDLDDLFSDLPTYIARQFFTPQKIALDRTGESENRVGEDIYATKKLKDEMSEWKGRRQKANRQISETKKEELKDLGYL
jgi:arylsulfatase A-like enzyme